LPTYYEWKKRFKELTKKDLSESGHKQPKFITPAIIQKPVGMTNQIGREVYFTGRRISVQRENYSRAKPEVGRITFYLQPHVPIA